MNTGTPELLVPPAQNSPLRKQLELKLKEYQARVDGKGLPWEDIHPYDAYILFYNYRNYHYKMRILTVVLVGKPKQPIDTWKLKFKLWKEHRLFFDFIGFNDACSVIAHYLGDTSIMITRGTGLPK